MAKKKKKNGGKKGGRAATKATQARSKPTRSNKARSKPAPRPRPASGGGGGRIHFTCSECYEEFTLGASQMKETLTCPECLHVGKRPQDNFLMTVKETRGREKRILTLAVLIAIIAVVAGAGVVLLLGPHAGVVSGLVGSDMATYLFGGGLALAVLIGIALAIQYEKNRWEVYF